MSGDVVLELVEEGDVERLRERIKEVEREHVKLEDRVAELERSLTATQRALSSVASQAASAARATKKGGR